jgi:transcription elongation factor GreA
MSTEFAARLAEILSLETAPARSLTVEQRERISEIFDRASDQEAIYALGRKAAEALAHYGGNLRARYALALYQELADHPEEAGLAFHELAREMGAQDDWEAAREMVLRALVLRPERSTVRLLLEIWEHLPDKTAMDEDIALAQAQCPEAPELLWFLSQRAGEEGRVNEEEDLALQALAQFVREKDGAGAEEPLLRLLESESVGAARELIRILPRMARGGLGELLDTALALMEPRIQQFHLYGDLAKSLENALRRGKGLGRLRPIYAEALKQALGGDEATQAFIADCGLADPEVPFEDAIEKFHSLYDLRPGAYVQHHNLGVGCIVAHDGPFLVIDFAEKKGHRMALEIAARSLHPLPENSLRVARFRDPEQIAHEIANDPVAVLVRALVELGGEAHVRQLRECLAGTTIPEDQWSSWWKRARDCAAQDPRVDTSQTFRQVYRLPSDAEEEIPLPSLPAKGGARSATTMIERLLKQHPELEERVKQVFAAGLAERVLRADTPGDALTAVPLLMRWLPERAEEWAQLARAAFRREPGVAAGITAQQQQELLDLGLAGEAWEDAALTALSSRFPEIRQQALAALKERLGDELPTLLREALTARDGRVNTRLALVRLSLAGQLQEAAFTPWELLLGVLRVLTAAPAPKMLRAALELLDPQEDLGRGLVGIEPDPEMAERVQRAAKELAASEVGLEPLVFLLAETGHATLVEELKVAQPQDTDPLALHFDPKVILMSRSTYQENMRKIEDLKHQLATVIPREIAAARSLGDLSENAEYHAARERQGIADATLRSLLSQMENARVIEDQNFPPDTIVAGTEVTLKNLDDGTERVLWLLGQGDSVQDTHVINYLAPLGQALIGKKVGDVVEVDTNGNIQRLQVLAIVPRLP